MLFLACLGLAWTLRLLLAIGLLALRRRDAHIAWASRLAYAPRGISNAVPTGPYVGEFDHFEGPWYRWTTPDGD